MTHLYVQSLWTVSYLSEDRALVKPEGRKPGTRVKGAREEEIISSPFPGKK